jgi:hypothetical protein
MKALVVAVVLMLTVLAVAVGAATVADAFDLSGECISGSLGFAICR